MKDSLIFGSQAARFWFPDFPRNPADLDIMSKEPKMSKDVQHYWWPTFEEIIDRNKDEKYLDPEFLLVIKMAHARWDIHWNKTLSDILFFKKKGIKADPEIYRKLVKDFTETHKKKWATLKGKDSETFFQDAVKRPFVSKSFAFCN